MARKDCFTSTICKIMVTRGELHSFPCPLDIDALSDEVIEKSVNEAEGECLNSLVGTREEWEGYNSIEGEKKDEMEDLFYGELELALLSNGAQYIEND